MRKIIWISLFAFTLIWYIFGKIWLNQKIGSFQFSDRDKNMVFPTPKTASFDSPISPTSALKPTITLPPSASDTSVIKF